MAINSAVVRTQLEDLQSEIEAGSRKLNAIAENAAEIRRSILERDLERQDLSRTLIRQIADLRKCVSQQRAALRDLRHAIRGRSRVR